MSGVPYIRFYGDDWLSGTQELSLEERGALVTVVALTSTTGNPPVADFKRLARRFGCTPGKAKKIIGSLVELGKIWIENGHVCNSRALSETEFSQKKSQKQTENANARWSKKTEKPNENSAGSDAIALPRECQPEPEPEPHSSSSSRRERGPIIAISDADRLLDEVLSAVGLINGNLPQHWMPPAATIHVWRWHSQLQIPLDQIVIAARNSRARHPDPPTGPKALDRVMQNLADELQSQPMTPKIINGGQHESSRSPDRFQRIITAAAEGTSGQDWG